MAVKTEEPKKKPDCYGVFCLTYDLIAVSVFFIAHIAFDIILV